MKHPPAVRVEALRLAREEGLAPTAIRRKLSWTFDTKPPSRATIAGWLDPSKVERRNASERKYYRRRHTPRHGRIVTAGRPRTLAFKVGRISALAALDVSPPLTPGQVAAVMDLDFPEDGWTAALVERALARLAGA